MDLALSPYHLTSREPAALAALLLGTRVLTVLPAVDATGGVTGLSAEETARAVPRYHALMREWGWSTPLWTSGVITADLRGDSPLADVRKVTRHIREDAAWTPLRQFLRTDEDEGEALLAAVASDLLKGGPDPGISVPVHAGLDRFAARRGLVVVRSRAQSMAQQAELALGRAIFTLALPVLTQASAQRILHVRDAASRELSQVRTLIRQIARDLTDQRADTAAPHRDDLADLHAAAAELQECFRARWDELSMGAEDDDVRLVQGVASITAVRLPWDAALTSSVRAFERFAGGVVAPPRRHDDPGAGARAGTLPALRDELAGATFLTLLVKPLGATAKR